AVAQMIAGPLLPIPAKGVALGVAGDGLVKPRVRLMQTAPVFHVVDEVDVRDLVGQVAEGLARQRLILFDRPGNLVRGRLSRAIRACLRRRRAAARGDAHDHLHGRRIDTEDVVEGLPGRLEVCCDLARSRLPGARDDDEMTLRHVLSSLWGVAIRRGAEQRQCKAEDQDTTRRLHVGAFSAGLLLMQDTARRTLRERARITAAASAASPSAPRKRSASLAWPQPPRDPRPPP